MGKVGAVLAVFLVAGATGWKGYRYFGTTAMPTCTIEGIEQGETYGHNVMTRIKGYDVYKVSSLSLELDGKPIRTVTIGKKVGELTFTLPIDQLTDGEHSITASVTGAGYHNRKATTTVSFTVDRMPLEIAFIKNGVDAKVYQGKTFHVQFRANKELFKASAKLFSKEYPCFLESNRAFIYECYIPVECEEAPESYGLAIEAVDRAGHKATLESAVKVLPFPFKKQVLNIPADKIKIENEQHLTEKDLEDQLEKLATHSPHKKLWQGPFITPIEIKDQKQITTEYGVIRATQERGLCQHKALDMYASPKSVVWAPQEGIVVLKNRFAHSGNTIVIDHGWGVFTLLFHLDTFAPIELGETIKKGKPVGTLGKTGYATGYHVHWEMRVGNVAVDPLEWTKQNF